MSSKQEEKLEKEFVDQLTPFQQIAYKIAIKNLESSFSLEKCIGFLEYKESKKSNPPS
jgi:hypothetical protein